MSSPRKRDNPKPEKGSADDPRWDRKQGTAKTGPATAALSGISQAGGSHSQGT